MSLEAAKQIDEICLRFEERLQSRAWPQIEEYLEKIEAVHRPRLLEELLQLELAYLRNNGQSIDSTRYEGRFESYSGIVMSVLGELADTTSASANQTTSTLSLTDFEIVGELGRGGMGVVYEANQKSLNRRVALKVLSSQLGLSAKAIMRFRREAEAAGRLHHTNIVPVHATGEQNGVHYYVMELIDGPSLDSVLAEMRSAKDRNAGPEHDGERTLGVTIPHDKSSGQQDIAIASARPATTSSLGDSSSLHARRDYFDKIANIIAEVADALEYAHEHGVVHRDMKPANLLVGSDGHLNVTDFGLARMLEQPGMTISGELVGSPLYMSPEQIAVGRMALDHRTDIYSLGATLYELLTLTPPFPGQHRDQVISQILTKEPSLPRSVNRRVPRDLETICLKAMEKDPDRRYQRAGQFANDLRHFVGRHAISARRIGIVGRAMRWTRRHRELAAALACIATLAVILISFAFYTNAKTNHLKRQAAQVALENEEEDALEAAFQGDLKTALNCVSKAEALRADDGASIQTGRVWAHMVRGIVALYRNQGAEQTAVVELKQAVQVDPQHVGAKALLATAYVWSGQWADYRRLAAHLEKVAIPSDLNDQFFLGQSLMWTDPNKEVELLKKVHGNPSRASSGVVSMVYAEALGHAAWHNNSMADSEASMQEALRATVILQRNPVPIAIANWSHLVAVQLRQAADKPFDDLLEKTASNVHALSHYDDYDIGYPCRAWYFDAAGNHETAIDLLTHCVVVRKRAGWIASMLAAEMYRVGRSQEALALLNQIDATRRDTIVDTARAFLIWDVRQKDGAGEIEQILDHYADRVKSDEQAAWAVMTIRLFTGDLEAARELSTRLRTLSPPRGPEVFDFISGSSTASEVLDHLAPNRMNECFARYLIGLWFLADDDIQGLEKGRAVLQPAVKAGGLMIDPQTHWIRAVYERRLGDRFTYY